jgi:purine-binding chemotaxis protein CheW
MSAAQEAGGPSVAPGAAPPSDSAPRELSDGLGDGADDRSGEQYVTFNVDSEVFAFPMAAVREIIRMPETLRVPLSPPTLNGVANLRGQVLPIVSLRRHFSFPDREDDAATRVIVVDNGGIVGFVVDSVASVITVQPEQREPVDSLQVAFDADMLDGLIKGVGGHAMVMILNVDRLISLKHAARAAATALSAAAAPAEDRGELTDERQLVSFVAAQQEYAFPIENVQEIVQVPEHISEVPNVAAHVVGVMTLRNRLLPLVSLRKMFHLPDAELSPQQRIVVISVEGESHTDGGVVGIVMDAVKEVLRVPLRLVDAVPEFLRARHEADEIEAICRLDDGRRLVSVLSVEKLFHKEALQEALALAPRRGEEDSMGAKAEQQGEGAQAEDEQLVVFRLADEEYGVAIDSVQEIIRMPESITHLPKAASFLAGIVNVRGAVLPIIDFRSRFGLTAVPRNDRQRIVVLSIDGTRTGFIVDSVSQVLKVARSTIEPTPSATDEQARIMGQIANLEQQKRMILILDARELLDRSELTAMRGAALPAAA